MSTGYEPVLAWDSSRSRFRRLWNSACTFLRTRFCSRHLRRWRYLGRTNRAAEQQSWGLLNGVRMPMKRDRDRALSRLNKGGSEGCKCFPARSRINVQFARRRIEDDQSGGRVRQGVTLHRRQARWQEAVGEIDLLVI